MVFSRVFTDGDTDFVKHEDVPHIDEHVYTSWCWMYFPGVSTASQNMYMLYKEASGKIYMFIKDGVPPNDHIINSFVGKTTSAAQARTAENIWKDNEWNFMATSFDDSATPKFKIYTGTTPGNVSLQTLVFEDDGVGTPSDTGTNHFLISGNGGATRSFAGRIFGAGLADRVLSLAELKKIAGDPWYSPEGTLVNSVLDGSTSFAKDISGRNNHGKITGCPIALGPPFIHKKVNAPIEVPWYALLEAALSSVSNTLTKLFHINEEVSNTNTHLFNIRNIISQTSTKLFNILAEISNTSTHLFDIASALSVVSNTLTKLFHINAEVSQTSTHRFDILNTISNTLTKIFNIRNIATQTSTHLFDIVSALSTVSNTLTKLFHINQQTSNTSTHKFDIDGDANGSQTIPFGDVKAQDNSGFGDAKG